MMLLIKNDGGFITNLHFAVLDADDDKKAVCISIFDRSKERIKSFWATFHIKPNIYDVNRSWHCVFKTERSEKPYNNDICSLSKGKENGYHLMAYSPQIGKNIDICHKEKLADSFYSLLMNNTKLPLLKEWSEPLLEWAINKGYVKVGHSFVGITESEACNIKIDLKDKGGIIPLSQIEVIRCKNITKEWILRGLKELKKSGNIMLSKKTQNPFVASKLDEYLSVYGHSIVENLKEVVKPLTELNGNIETCALKKIRLYPQQIAQVHGGVKVLNYKNYAILNMGMGVGKTIVSIATCEKREVEKWLKQHPGKTVKDAYLNDNIHYRSVVMAPGHMLNKWARTIKENIPYANVEIITTLEQVLALRNISRKAERKEFYIIGKDFAKLSYTYKPAVTKVLKKDIMLQRCTSCSTLKQIRGRSVCSCGCSSFKKEKLGRKAKGLICPACGELLYPYQDSQNWNDDTHLPLMPEDFAELRDKNSYCYYCGESLWEPCVANIDTDINNLMGLHKKPDKWHKIKHYTNARNNATKNAWVLQGYEASYLEKIGKADLGESRVVASRKVSPAYIIKKYLKDFFDYGIFDEAHLYKGGSTAQGNAFASLVKASKKQLLLTGTIANGYANSLFYLLYRVDSGLMKKLGYNWKDETAFVKKYGTLETKFAADDNAVHLKTSKGKQLSAPTVKAGMSPLLVMDLLLPVQLTLDLSDMSKFLPPLKETVIPVTPDEEMITSLEQDIANFKLMIKRDERRTILSTMLQYALSYPDKPYGRNVIRSAITGAELIKPKDLSHLVAGGKLLNKERELVSLVEKELGEDRNCVIYCEFTNSSETIITQRIKQVLFEKVAGLEEEQISIIESSSPKAIDREEWMHERAREGVRVFIVNPRCVETGLDFVWTETDDFGNEVEYNFPTLIFYQSGYNLYTLWQASRRAYRLCQRKECRNYYLAYLDTIQMEVLQILAEKQTATTAIQGKFSAEGLAAMSKQVDPRIRLAKALCDADTTNVNELQNMFDAVNQVNAASSDFEKEILKDYKPMKLFDEIIGIVNETENIDKQCKCKCKKDNFSKFLEMVSETISWSFDGAQQQSINIKDSIVRGKKKSKSQGQLGFDLFF